MTDFMPAPENGDKIRYVDEHGLIFDASIQAVFADGTVTVRILEAFDIRHVKHDQDKHPNTWHWINEEQE